MRANPLLAQAYGIEMPAHRAEAAGAAASTDSSAAVVIVNHIKAVRFAPLGSSDEEEAASAPEPAVAPAAATAAVPDGVRSAGSLRSDTSCSSRQSAVEELPELSDVFGDDDHDHMYVPSERQLRFDRQEALWQSQVTHLYPADGEANTLLGQLLDKFDRLTTGMPAGNTAAASPQDLTRRIIYKRGCSGKSKENLCAISNDWELLDDAAVLARETFTKYGKNQLLGATREKRAAALAVVRRAQLSETDNFFYDAMTDQLARVMHASPVKCASAMLDVSLETNMCAFDAIYPEEAARAQEQERVEKQAAQAVEAARLAAATAAAQQGATPEAQAAAGAKAARAAQSGMTPPARVPLAAQRKGDCEKALAMKGFLVLPREYASPERATAAFELLHQHHLGIHVRDYTQYSLSKTRAPTAIQPAKFEAFMKLPFDLVDEASLRSRMTLLGLSPLASMGDPRLPPPSEAGRATKGKPSQYMRWLLGALMINGRDDLISDETICPEVTDLIDRARTFGNEGELLKDNAEVKRKLSDFYEQSTESTSHAEKFHRLLFALLLDMQAPPAALTDASVLPCPLDVIALPCLEPRSGV